MRYQFLILASVFVIASPAAAAVVDLRPSGFTIQHEADVAATPQQMFERFGQPALWWNGNHTWWGNAENLSMDLKAGGCWCERTEDGASEAEHMRVTFVDRYKSIRLSGVLGPLSMQGATGAMTVTFAPVGDKTRVTMRYDIEGHFVPPPAQLAPLVDKVLAEQFSRYTTVQ